MVNTQQAKDNTVIRMSCIDFSSIKKESQEWISRHCHPTLETRALGIGGQWNHFKVYKQLR
jgi:hypothetical protein